MAPRNGSSRSGGSTNQVAQATRQLAGRPRDGKRWFVTSKLHTMIVVPAPGRILVGSPDEELERDENEHLHEVEIVYPFAISAAEVTVRQFEEFGPAEEARRNGALDDFPMSFVSWARAAAYCNWLSAQEKITKSQEAYPDLDPNGTADVILPQNFVARRGFRLPTEHEWEHAARCGASTSRFYGNSDKDLEKYAWFAANSLGKGTAPVGQFRPNPLGLFDIYGNVDEWCEIWPQPANDPDIKSARGGTYRGVPKFMRSAMPHPQPADAEFSTRGFRIAITLQAP